MSSPRLRAILSALALASAAVLATGCASSPGSPAPTSSADQDAGDSPAQPSIGEGVEAAWLDGGRGFAVVTWGSSSCVPQVEDVTAEGQKITVSLVDGDADVCSADIAPRATYAGMPEGVDVTADVEVDVVYEESTQSTTLTALDEAPQGAGEQRPSAGWLDESSSVLLLTWGSSSCPPVVSEVTQTDAGAEVTFAEDETRMCTMDFAPRLTTIFLPEKHSGGPFTLTLIGDNLDAEVPVLS